MNKIVLTLALLFSSSVFASEAKVELPKEDNKTKKVCIMQKDAKTQKEKEVCREVKVHRKLEGTKVPEKK
jgi:hypothetical protein